MTPTEVKTTPSFIDAFIPVLSLIIMLSASVYYFGDNSAGGPNQIALLLASGVAMLIGIKNGHTWESIEKSMVNGISLSLGAIFILLAVGALIGTWLLSGTVPTMIYFGLQLLSPQWFYAASCIICGIVAISIGSSWTTAATIGVALIGISNGLELSMSITAGAVISGAYFGDKVSPLSETTNLAPAVAGSELFSHIRYMVWTTVPAIVISLIIFVILGFSDTSVATEGTIDGLTKQLEANFNISVFNLIPLALLLALAVRKMPAFPAIAIGALFGGLWGIIFQPELVTRLAEQGASVTTANITVLWSTLFDGVTFNTGDAELDDLLSRGGMSNMLNTIWLVMCALIFGAVLEHLGMLQIFVARILSSVKSIGGLITSTVTTCIGTNAIAADQYIAIVMPGRMYKEEYKRRGLDPLVLSRTLEDSGTITSPLVPWNTCGAFMFGALALTSYDYIFYCFFNLLCPVLAVIYGYTGYKIKYLDKKVDTAAPVSN